MHPQHHEVKFALTHKASLPYIPSQKRDIISCHVPWKALKISGTFHRRLLSPGLSLLNAPINVETILTLDESLEKLHKEIDHQIRNIGKNIVVLIDDIDRL